MPEAFGYARAFGRGKEAGAGSAGLKTSVAAAAATAEERVDALVIVGLDARERAAGAAAAAVAFGDARGPVGGEGHATGIVPGRLKLALAVGAWKKRRPARAGDGPAVRVFYAVAQSPLIVTCMG